MIQVRDTEKTAPTVMARCTHCGAEREVKIARSGEPKLPMGWRRNNGLWCRTCWGSEWCCIAISMPVVGPEGRTWDELRPYLRTCFEQARRVVNWAMTRLYTIDVQRFDGVKMKPMGSIPSVEWYGEAVKLAPNIAPTSVTAILQSTLRKYKEARFGIIVAGNRSLPSARHPQPYPVTSQSWRAYFDSGDRPMVSVPLSTGGDRFELRLRGGSEYRRQLARFRQVVEGRAIGGELMLHERSANRSDNRGQSSRGSRLMCKLVMWAPKHRATGREGTLLVRTDADDALVYCMQSDAHDAHVGRFCADHIKRICARHAREVDHMAQDMKYEKRVPRHRGDQMRDRLREISEKRKNRIDSFVDETTASLVGIAVRRRVADVVLESGHVSFVPQFPWFQFGTTLEQKLRREGIEFRRRDASDDAVTETP